MTGLVASVGIGVLTNTIYDIVKYAGAKFYNSQFKEKDIRESIETKILDGCPESLRALFESSSYITYFNSPQFIDVANAYLTHKLLCNYASGNARIRKYLKKDCVITAEDVINYISDNIHEVYEKNGALTIPTIAEIKDATTYMLRVSEEVIAENLSPENSRMVYLINSRLDIYYNHIIDMLSKLQDSIRQIQEKQIVVKDNVLEEIKDKYHSILAEKNSDAHIYLLDKFPFEKFYVPPVLQRSYREDEDLDMYFYAGYSYSFTKWKDIFVNNNIVYLTGGAGYGKSLFTKKIINDYKDLNIFHSHEYIVIYGELKSFYPNGSDTAISVVEFLKESIKTSTLMDVTTDFIEHYLDAGRCIILLDALDEVEKSKRVSLHESVVAYFKSQNPNNKICITSRDRGFIPERNVEVFKICPLNEEQIEKYVDKIIALGKFEKADKEPFMKQSAILVRKGFLNSFLVLSLLISIYKAERELPENKLELYQKCFEYISNKREKDKTQKEFDWKVISPIMKDNTFIELSRMGLPNNSDIDRKDIKDKLLQIYKTKYVSEAETENAIDEFLKFCADRTELFVPTLEDKFKFFHRSFFEYFYSLYIYLRCKNENERLEELLKFDVDSEVFELTVAMLKQQSEEDYQALIELMFEKTEEEFSCETGDFSVFNILILSMQVIDDALYRKRFSDIIIEKKIDILKNIDCIHNLRLLSTIYDNDVEFCKEICDAYEDESLMFLFDGCDRLFKMAETYSKEQNEDFFQNLLSDNQSKFLRRQLVFRAVDRNEKFFITMYFKMYDCKEILLQATEEILLRIYKKYSHKNYKKKTAHTISSLEVYRKFSEREQVKLARIIFFNPYKLRNSKVKF